MRGRGPVGLPVADRGTRASGGPGGPAGCSGAAPHRPRPHLPPRCLQTQRLRAHRPPRWPPALLLWPSNAARVSRLWLSPAKLSGGSICPMSLPTSSWVPYFAELGGSLGAAPWHPGTLHTACQSAAWLGLLSAVTSGPAPVSPFSSTLHLNAHGKAAPRASGQAAGSLSPTASGTHTDTGHGRRTGGRRLRLEKVVWIQRPAFRKSRRKSSKSTFSVPEACSQEANTLISKLLSLTETVLMQN